MPDRIRVKVITRSDMNQTYVEFGHPGIKASDDDALATRLMSYILGGGAMSSRLGVSVREKGGLAYDVRCWFDRNRYRGGFHATVQTAGPKEAIAMMLHDIRLMHDSGATRKELEKAHNYYTGSFPLTYASTYGKLGQVRAMELYGYGMDWLDKFPDKVRAVVVDGVLELAELALEVQRFLLGHPVERAVGGHLLEVLQALDRRLDRLEVGQHAAEPALVDVGHRAAPRFLGDDVARLALGADEQDRALVRRQLADELHRLLVHLHRLLEVDDVDLVALAEDVLCHLRIPVPRLVAEVDPGFQHLTHRYRHLRNSDQG